jgi:hypothetical protein
VEALVIRKFVDDPVVVKKLVVVALVIFPFVPKIVVAVSAVAEAVVSVV